MGNLERTHDKPINTKKIWMIAYVYIYIKDDLSICVHVICMHMERENAGAN